MLLASYIHKFFNDTFLGIINRMDLVHNVDWLSTVLNKPIFYNSPLYIVVQD